MTCQYLTNESLLCQVHLKNCRQFIKQPSSHVKVYQQLQTRYPELNEFPQDYRLVALIPAADLEEIWIETQNLDGPWIMDPNVYAIHGFDSKLRSCVVGDVYVLDDKPWVVAKVGIRELTSTGVAPHV